MYIEERIEAKWIEGESFSVATSTFFSSFNNKIYIGRIKDKRRANTCWLMVVNKVVKIDGSLIISFFTITSKNRSSRVVCTHQAKRFLTQLLSWREKSRNVFFLYQIVLIIRRKLFDCLLEG